LSEKLVVEFDVDEEVQLEYGIVEKYLKRFGEKLPYKAIVKNGKFVSIVGSKYTVVPNETVETIAKKIAKNHKLNIEHENWRIYCFIDTGNDGIIIMNSIDGSMGLRVSYFYKVKEGAKAITNTKELKQIYRKHTKNIEKLTNQMEAICNNILIEGRKRIKYIMEELQNKFIKDNIDALKGVTEALPKCYTKSVWEKFAHGKIYTVKQLYEEIAAAIWNSDKAGIKTKIEHFRRLNTIFTVLGIKAR